MPEELQHPLAGPTPPAEPPDATAADFDIFRNVHPREPFTLPTGKRVWVCGIPDNEKQDWLNSCRKRRDADGAERIDDPLANAKLIVRMVRNSAGQTIFKEADLTRIYGWDPLVLAPLIDLCTKVAAIGGKADEEILKNYAQILTAGS